MAPMPEIRLKTPLHAFACTAVDFGGPFILFKAEENVGKSDTCVY